MRGRDFWLLVAAALVAPHIPIGPGLGFAAFAALMAWRRASKGD